MLVNIKPRRTRRSRPLLVGTKGEDPSPGMEYFFKNMSITDSTAYPLYWNQSTETVENRIVPTGKGILEYARENAIQTTYQEMSLEAIKQAIKEALSSTEEEPELDGPRTKSNAEKYREFNG